MLLFKAPSKLKKKKQKYSRIQEFVDLGDGYDNDDPFIDNTEAVSLVLVIITLLGVSSLKS